MNTEATLTLQIQDFLGWALALDQAQFVSVLDNAGHRAPAYQAQKWAEFSDNKLAFMWNWAATFVPAWLADVKAKR